MPGCPPGKRFRLPVNNSVLDLFFCDFLSRSVDDGFDEVLLSRLAMTRSFSISCFNF